MTIVFDCKGPSFGGLNLKKIEDRQTGSRYPESCTCRSAPCVYSLVVLPIGQNLRKREVVDDETERLRWDDVGRHGH